MDRGVRREWEVWRRCARYTDSGLSAIEKALTQLLQGHVNHTTAAFAQPLSQSNRTATRLRGSGQEIKTGSRTMFEKTNLDYTF